MAGYLKIIITILLTIGVFGCGSKHHDVPFYKVSKVFKTDSITTVNVHIRSRITAPQLLSIAAKLKTDSVQIKNLEIHYLLPGNTEISMGDNSYYASARLLKEKEVKPADTLKDDDGNVFRIKIFGLSDKQVKHLLTLQSKEIAMQNVLGKFIDDYSSTVIIPFIDKEKEFKIVELDSTAKVVSATVPLKIVDDGVVKWQVTQHGDYITLKDSVLTQYSADGLGVPFNSIKSGM